MKLLSVVLAGTLLGACAAAETARPTPGEASGPASGHADAGDTGDNADAGAPGTGAASEAGAPQGDPQRAGDPVRGRALLLNNGTPGAPYINCGTPETLVTLGGLLDPGQGAIKIADRDANNADLPYYMSRAVTPSGVKIITVNCLMCHASPLGQGLVIGLGNPNRDFSSTGDDGATFGFTEAALEASKVVLDPAEGAELDRTLSRSRAIAAFDTTDTVGLNPADAMFGALAAHHDPATLTWSDTANADLGPAAAVHIFSDVPTWFGVHRRDRMFYSGFGQGDHARIMMSSALLCMDDASEAPPIDAYFPDVEAYIESLRAPSYESVSGLTIDTAAAARGEVNYEAICSTCHGSRSGDDGRNPVPFVPLSLVGTDPVYAEATTVGTASQGAVSYFFDFFNTSWYGTYGAAGRLVRNAEPGYSPPPLDGIWASAPYFHNGSVPTLDAVLDPSLRPAVYRRSTDPTKYDFTRLGWPYQTVASKGTDTTVYDTTAPGHAASGHTFAAGLTDVERRDLLEYLKTF